MKRKFDNEDLRYIDERVDRLFKEFRKFELLCYSWQRKNQNEFDALKEKGGVK